MVRTLALTTMCAHTLRVAWRRCAGGRCCASCTGGTADPGSRDTPAPPDGRAVRRY